mmetsp:Transcript_38819/g.91298  ORF Transcript_38819/g.91298 Transcript_38819/m.91298 type:complete len:706 (-) Transcript_38819:66-2183(-)
MAEADANEREDGLHKDHVLDEDHHGLHGHVEVSILTLRGFDAAHAGDDLIFCRCWIQSEPSMKFKTRGVGGPRFTWNEKHSLCNVHQSDRLVVSLQRFRKHNPVRGTGSKRISDIATCTLSCDELGREAGHFEVDLVGSDMPLKLSVAARVKTGLLEPRTSATPAYEKTASRVEVTILKASGLVGHQGPRCACQIVDHAYSIFSTRWIGGSTHPSWNEEHILFDYVEGDALKFTVYDHQLHPLPDQPMGECTLDSRAFANDGFAGTLKLHLPSASTGAGSGDATAGTLEVRVTPQMQLQPAEADVGKVEPPLVAPEAHQDATSSDQKDEEAKVPAPSLEPELAAAPARPVTVVTPEVVQPVPEKEAPPPPQALPSPPPEEENRRARRNLHKFRENGELLQRKKQAAETNEIGVGTSSDGPYEMNTSFIEDPGRGGRGSIPPPPAALQERSKAEYAVVDQALPADELPVDDLGILQLLLHKAKLDQQRVARMPPEQRGSRAAAYAMSTAAMAAAVAAGAAASIPDAEARRAVDSTVKAALIAAGDAVGGGCSGAPLNSAFRVQDQIRHGGTGTVHDPFATATSMYSTGDLSQQLGMQQPPQEPNPALATAPAPAVMWMPVQGSFRPVAQATPSGRQGGIFSPEPLQFGGEGGQNPAQVPRPTSTAAAPLSSTSWHAIRQSIDNPAGMLICQQQPPASLAYRRYLYP